MSYEDAVKQLEKLLQRNLFLSPELKQKILTSSPAKQKEVWSLVQSIDTKQTTLFKRALKKNPHFFADLENDAIHETLTKMMAEEEGFRVDEINAAEDELLAALNDL